MQIILQVLILLVVGFHLALTLRKREVVVAPLSPPTSDSCEFQGLMDQNTQLILEKCRLQVKVEELESALRQVPANDLAVPVAEPVKIVPAQPSSAVAIRAMRLSIIGRLVAENPGMSRKQATAIYDGLVAGAEQ